MSEQAAVRPDVVVIMTDQERAAPSYEADEVAEWRRRTLTGARWFEDHGISFRRHYTGSVACVPSRPTLFTGHYPDVHGVTQTNGLGKMEDDSRMRWLRRGEVPTLGNWFRAGGYDTHYQGKWHITHADLINPVTGRPLAANDGRGNTFAAAEQAYLDADPLGPFGFSGWIGPEPHGPGAAHWGLVRDRIIANRVIDWLQDRYRRRGEGDLDAQRPFLLVASFVNPHDIVYFPGWLGRFGPNPISVSSDDPPRIPGSPTDNEDLSTKPAAQIAYRASYPTTYGPAPLVERTYRDKADAYRHLYYRLHAEVDGPLDRVRRAVTDGGSDEAIIVRTSDHGELLGAHGGLHQKWFNLYDEATRVPFVVTRVGARPTEQRVIDDSPTSHIDLVPTLLAAAGINEGAAAQKLAESFSELHPLPGRNLMPIIDGDTAPDRHRPVYLQTRDNMPEGDSGLSGLARQLAERRGRNSGGPSSDGPRRRTPPPMRIQVPAHVAANFESLVVRVTDDDAPGGQDHLWKVVRTFDDPDTWTEPGVRHLASSSPTGDRHRTEPLPDQWELYDLDVDPIEAANRWTDQTAQAVLALLQRQLADERNRSVPQRHTPWPYASRESGDEMPKVPPPARALRKLLQRAGMHPDDTESFDGDLTGRRALVVATNHDTLDDGKPTGVFASEMTVPYYAFVDAGMQVDVASPNGGMIPVDPQSLKPVVRTKADDRFMADNTLQALVTQSKAVGDLNMDDYDVVYLAGGWGAAFDLGQSAELGRQITEANRLGRVIGGVCHGPLGLLQAKGVDGNLLVDGRRVTAVTDKQVKELRIETTPLHPETALREAGANFESATRFRDPLANHWVVDGNLVTGQNQNAAPMVAREMMRLVETDTRA